mmetsp:Transcript_128846/g.223453  ORF Transcript_128846/g.223453 Transcript_128846/m.223453 type:complete len:218 (-) Transcript_128846:558-1211(-)
MCFTVLANVSVLKLSSKFAIAGLKVPIIAVLEFPLNALESNNVSFELRNFDMFSLLSKLLACKLFLDTGVVIVLRRGVVPSAPRLWMQWASHIKLRLMNVNSTKRSPVTLVVFSFSRPARSTKNTSDITARWSSPPRFSRASLNTVCARELFAFMAVAATVFMVFPYSTSLTQCSKDSTASSVTPLRYTPSFGCTWTSGWFFWLLPCGRRRSLTFSL